MMKVVFALLALFALSQAAQVGVAYLTATSQDSGVTGTVYFVLDEATNLVWVWPVISGITQNPNDEHGIHVHEFGDLSNTATAASAGGHYIGAGIATHGCPDTTARHEGDMGNWTASAGSISGPPKTLDLLALTGGFSIIGKAVVLHQQRDNCTTNTTGDAGTRLAFGVIGIANNASLPAEVLAVTNGPFASNAAVSGDTNVVKAIAVLNPTTANATLNNVSGIVSFEQGTNGLIITGVFYGLTPTTQQGFGLHIHAFGSYSSDAMAAGGHFNTGTNTHAAPPDTNRHNGDLGNICSFDSAGVAYYSYTVTDGYISLNGDKNILGRNIIVHGLYDTAVATTNFGSRVSQGVIGVYNKTAAIKVAIPSSVSVSSNPRCLASATTTATTATGTTGTPTSSASLLTCGSLFFMLLALLF